MYRVEQRPQCRFQHTDAESGVLISAFLAGEVVRRMVGSHAVNDAVGQADDAGGHIVRRPQGRIDFCRRVVGRRPDGRPALAAQRPILSKHQMVRADFGGHRQPPLFGGAHQCHAAGGAQVRQMQASAGQLGQRNIPRHHRLLGHRRDAGQAQAAAHPPLGHHAARTQRMLLAVVADRQPQIAAVGQRQTHQRRIIHRIPVIAESDAARRRQLLQIRQLLPRPPLADAPDGLHPHRRRRPALPHIVHHGGVVHRRVGVGHRADGGKAAPRRRRRPARNGLLVLKTRLPQMGMDINKTGANHHPIGADDRYIARRRRIAHPRADGNNAAVGQQNISNAVPPGRRVNHPTAGYQQRTVRISVGVGDIGNSGRSHSSVLPAGGYAG